MTGPENEKKSEKVEDRGDFRCRRGNPACEAWPAILLWRGAASLRGAIS